jgi:transcriptional regulator with XRE-family HTH domain
MGSKEEFVVFIKEELSKRNWSHAELARRGGISQAHISRVMKGGYQPGFGFLFSISKCMNYPIEFLLQKAGFIEKKIFKTNNELELIETLSKLEKSDLELILDIAGLLLKRKD